MNIMNNEPSGGGFSFKKYYKEVKIEGQYSETISATFNEVKDWSKCAIIVETSTDTTYQTPYNTVLNYVRNGNIITMTIGAHGSGYMTTGYFTVFEFSGRVRVFSGSQFVAKSVRIECKDMVAGNSFLLYTIQPTTTRSSNGSYIYSSLHKYELSLIDNYLKGYVLTGDEPRNKIALQWNVVELL